MYKKHILINLTFSHIWRRFRDRIPQSQRKKETAKQKRDQHGQHLERSKLRSEATFIVKKLQLEGSLIRAIDTISTEVRLMIPIKPAPRYKRKCKRSSIVAAPNAGKFQNVNNDIHNNNLAKNIQVQCLRNRTQRQLKTKCPIPSLFKRTSTSTLILKYHHTPTRPTWLLLTSTRPTSIHTTSTHITSTHLTSIRPSLRQTRFSLPACSAQRHFKIRAIFNTAWDNETKIGCIHLRANNEAIESSPPLIDY